ncbi:MAG: maleylacetoacetate isomerase [Micropepsaceae bacterium]
MTLVHYTYAHSSAAYRTRIALNLKGLKPEERFVHLLKDGGQQHGAEYAALNPLELIPTLIDGDATITQSLAIIEYLDEVYPEPPLLPKGAVARARVRQIALSIACDIHPVNNLRVRQYLSDTLKVDAEASKIWYRHWIDIGFKAVETMLDAAGPYACGSVPTLADVVLVPQVANARRFDIPLGAYPRIVRANAAATALPAFAAAAPDQQADFGR